MKGKYIFCVLVLFLIPIIGSAEGDFIDYFDTTAGHNADGVATDNNFIWVISDADDEVYKYFMNGTYTGIHWDTSPITGNGAPYGITTNGTDFWIVDLPDDLIRRFTLAGTYVDSFSVDALNANPFGITTDGNFIWIQDYIDEATYKYFMNGTYTGEVLDLSGTVTDTRGVTTNGTYLWVSDIGADEIWKFWINGSYTGISFDTSTQTSVPLGLANNVSFIWVGGGVGDKVFRYEGLPIAPVDTCTCPGAGNNWEIDMSDFCEITEACDLTTGTLSFTGAGWAKCDAGIKTTNLGDPGATGVLYILDDCRIQVS